MNNARPGTAPPTNSFVDKNNSENLNFFQQAMRHPQFSINQSFVNNVKPEEGMDFSMSLDQIYNQTATTAPIPIARRKSSNVQEDNWDESSFYNSYNNNNNYSFNNSPSVHNQLYSPLSDAMEQDMVPNSFNFGSNMNTRPSRNSTIPIPINQTTNQQPNFNTKPVFSSNQMYSMSVPTRSSSDFQYAPDLKATPQNSLNSSSGTFNANMTGEEIAKRREAQILERKRRRRENHNAVERRRRDVINDKIQELSTLLPEEFIEANKINKGLILRRSVDYIKHLQNVINSNGLQVPTFDLSNFSQGNFPEGNFPDGSFPESDNL